MKYTFIKTNVDGTEEVVKHYGVLGMKWGVRKAREYGKDVNQVRRNKKVAKARQKYNIGKISKDEFKAERRKANAEHKEANKQLKSELKKIKVDRTKKVSDIYQPYKTKAYKEINKYAVKRFLYKARSFIRKASMIAVGGASAAAIAAGGAAFIPAYAGVTLYQALNLGVNAAIVETASKKLRHL